METWTHTALRVHRVDRLVYSCGFLNSDNLWMMFNYVESYVIVRAPPIFLIEGAPGIG